MVKLLIYFSLLFGFALQAQGQSETSIIKLEDLHQIIEEPSTKIKVINFWATWCAPCIKELPQFEALNRKRDDVMVILISLDLDLDPDPEKVYKFIERKNLKSQVLLLNEQDPNSWINTIDEQWSGALPATLIINSETGQRKFIGNEIHDGELEKLVDELLYDYNQPS
jgi:thiol-disulfide isomerase/thioredoxin